MSGDPGHGMDIQAAAAKDMRTEKFYISRRAYRTETP